MAKREVKKIRVKKNLREIIDLNGWPALMLEMIGKSFNVDDIQISSTNVNIMYSGQKLNITTKSFRIRCGGTMFSIPSFCVKEFTETEKYKKPKMKYKIGNQLLTDETEIFIVDEIDDGEYWDDNGRSYQPSQIVEKVKWELSGKRIIMNENYIYWNGEEMYREDMCRLFKGYENEDEFPIKLDGEYIDIESMSRKSSRISIGCQTFDTEEFFKFYDFLGGQGWLDY